MKRIEFFKQITGLASAWLLGHGKPPASTEYALYEGWIAGYRYYDGPALENRFKAGYSLQLHREPQNSHDRNAISIYTGKHKLGYIARDDNEIVAKLMDQGAEVGGEIVKFNPEAENWERVLVGVRMKG